MFLYLLSVKMSKDYPSGVLFLNQGKRNMGRDILSLNTVRRGDITVAGGKRSNLGEMVQNGFPVPPGFVVSARVCEAFLLTARKSEHCSGFKPKAAKNHETSGFPMSRIRVTVTIDLSDSRYGRVYVFTSMETVSFPEWGMPGSSGKR